MINENGVANLVTDIDFLEDEFKKSGHAHLNAAFLELRLVRFRVLFALIIPLMYHRCPRLCSRIRSNSILFLPCGKPPIPHCGRGSCSPCCRNWRSGAPSARILRPDSAARNGEKKGRQLVNLFKRTEGSLELRTVIYCSYDDPLTQWIC